MIYVECKPDFKLVECLLGTEKEIKHAMGKNRICNKLRKERNCTGLIDEDPGRSQHPYLKQLSPESNLSRDRLKTLHDDRNKNHLIVLCPRLEEWVLKAAKEAKIDIKRYNLPDDGERLHKVININIDKFEKLIKDLRGKSRMMKALEKSIKGN